MQLNADPSSHSKYRRIEVLIIEALGIQVDTPHGVSVLAVLLVNALTIELDPLRKKFLCQHRDSNGPVSPNPRKILGVGLRAGQHNKINVCE